MSDGETLILTPTARLARAELRRLGDEHLASGAAAWIQPAVLAFPTWLARLRDDYFLNADDARVPISVDQALLLWQSVIDREVFVGEPRVAELAMGAWRLIHEHGLTAPEHWSALSLSEDTRAMQDWAARFVSLCERRGLIDEWRFAAELPSRIEAGELALPSTLRLLGFELPMTPLQQKVLAAARGRGVIIEQPALNEDALRPWAVTVFDQPDEELLAAARWARGQLEARPEARVAVVVPDLNGRVAAVERRFRQVFDPSDFALAPQSAAPWHVSLGLPLSQWPIVADALLVLALNPQRIAHPDAARLVRSPFLDSAEFEARARSRLLSRLIGKLPYWLDARELAWQAGRCGAERLGGLLTVWQRLRRDQSRRAVPSAWARAFAEELGVMAFGHGRALDSREFQVWRRWQELLERFGMLDAVVEQPLTRQRALKLLRERAAATTFRERNPGAPVEILGVEEALGSRFDALWITTLDQDHWPSASQRHPLIPPAVQQSVPAASSEGALARARLELSGLGRCAPEISGSFVSGEGEQTLSALLPAHAETVCSAPPALPIPALLERIESDALGPPTVPEARRGGTGLLQRQSDCPFKAFAVDRLGARELTPPRPGLNPMLRGILVHAALRQFWTEIDSLASLRALDAGQRTQRIAGAVQTALDELLQQDRLALSPAGQVLEQRCLERSLDAWLVLEAEREPFRVTAREQAVELVAGPLRLSGTIDRIDELDGGGSVLIDYKTGSSARASNWKPDARLADVQLPAYAVSLSPPPVAVSFATLRADIQAFSGLAEVDAGMPGVPELAAAGQPWAEMDSWRELLANWRASLDALAVDFCTGQAAVDPRSSQVCQRCHLAAFCRIAERAPLAEEGEDE